MSNKATVIILLGMFGAVLQEIVHWYGLRSSLKSSRYRRLLASAPYWTITVIMVVAAGIGTWIWYEGGEQRSLREYCLTGAAFPLLLKKAVSAFVEKSPTLGMVNPAGQPNTEEVPSSKALVRDYFNVS